MSDPKGGEAYRAALQRMDKDDYERYLRVLRKKERRARRHARRLARITLRDYNEDHPGHPLGPGMPTGGTFRMDGESHKVAWMTVLRRDPCSFCGREGGTVDHIVPRSAGGPGLHDWTNFGGACASCNSSKSSVPLLEFLGRRHGLLYPRPKAHWFFGRKAA